MQAPSVSTSSRREGVNTVRNTRKGILILALLALGACNAVQGAGQDIESVGRKSEEVIKGD